MNQAVRNSLTEAELLLVAETERPALDELDEDALLDLHVRVRRARTKYVKLYRRTASARVSQHGGRGMAGPKSQRNRDKAELFELALARVSRRIGVVAKQAAAELKAERLEDARAVRSGRGPGTGRVSTATAPAAGRRPATRKTTGGAKKDASTRSQGARRQAKRDSR